jgi:hypothetical protein
MNEYTLLPRYVLENVIIKMCPGAIFDSHVIGVGIYIGTDSVRDCAIESAKTASVVRVCSFNDSNFYRLPCRGTSLDVISCCLLHRISRI